MWNEDYTRWQFVCPQKKGKFYFLGVWNSSFAQDKHPRLYTVYASIGVYPWDRGRPYYVTNGCGAMNINFDCGRWINWTPEPPAPYTSGVYGAPEEWNGEHIRRFYPLTEADRE